MVIAVVVRPEAHLPRAPTGWKVLQGQLAHRVPQPSGYSEATGICAVLRLFEQFAVQQHVHEMTAIRDGPVDSPLFCTREPPLYDVP
jgi:hypothetical protein